MSDVVATLVVNFGEDTASESGAIIAEWDDTMNVGADGEVKSQFFPGDEAYLLVHHDATAIIQGVKTTSGAIVSTGEATLTRTAELGWGDPDDAQSLNYLLAGQLAYRWFGNAGSGAELVDKSLRMTGGQFPCLAEVSHSVAFTRYRLQTPAVTLAKDETWPIRVYIYYVEVDE